MNSETGQRPVALEVRGLGKHFGGIQALDDFDLKVHEGEVVSIVGDNGAGKSTFIKMVSGLYQPSHGRILLSGQEVEIESPGMGRKMGIETVYQNAGLVDVLNIGGNFFLGRELFHPNPILRFFGHLDKKEMSRQASAAISALGAKVTGTAKKPVGQLSGGQRASVLIGRASHFGSNLLLLDEPTAALGVEQSAAVVQMIIRAGRSGLPIIVISHNLQEVFEVSDRIVVLRLGKKVADLQKAQTTTQEVVAYITGANEVAA